MTPTSPERLYDRAFLAAFVSMVAFVLANALMAHYARWISWLGGDVTQIGWIMGAGSIAGLLLRPWLGQWINRLGARTVWGTGILLFAAGSAGNLLLHDLSPVLYVLRAAIVLGAAFVFASGLTYVAQTAPPARRTEAIGSLGAAGFIGMMTGPGLGDLILGAGERSRAVFDTFFITTTVAMVVPFLLLPALPSTGGADRAREVRLADFFRTAREHWPGTVLLMALAFGISMSVPFGFLAEYVDVTNTTGEPGRGMTIFFLAYGGWGLTVRILLRRLPDLMGRRKFLVAGMAMMGLGMFTFLWIDRSEPLWLLVPGFVCGTGHALSYPTLTSLTIERFPSRVSGTGSALLLMVLDIGMVGGAPVLGRVAAAWGFSALFSAVGASCLAATAVFTAVSVPIWARQARERRAARLASPGASR